MHHSQRTRVTRSSRRRPNRLDFLNLEPRNLLAGISFDSGTGIVTISGSSDVDQVQLVQKADKVNVIYHGHSEREFDVSELSGVVFLGGAGNDWFKNQTEISARAYGQLGDDVLIGGENDDTLIGGGGNDRMYGRQGDDFIAGNDGDDLIQGGDGDDQILGGDDADHMIGGIGNDLIFGQRGGDFLFGGDGDDFLAGGDDNDLISGDSGSDSVRGNHGNDRVWGGDGDDILRGGDGDDRVVGGKGDDSVHGDAGSDHLQGNEGLDHVFGSLGDDILFGGDGDDVLVGNEGNDIVVGNLGNDLMLGNDGSDYLQGDDGHDRMYAGDGDDVLRGGNGRDHLSGQNGDDDLDGENDNDDLSGGRDSDRLRGGQGNDDYSSDDSDVIFDDSDDYGANDDFEIRGLISNFNSTDMTFSLLGFTVDYASAYVDGPIADGSFVEVEGAYSGEVVTAQEVEIEDDPNRDDNIETRGVISGLDTGAKTFQFLGFVVSYGNSRVDGSLANGSRFELKGNYDGNGFIDAHRVEIESGDGGQDDSDDSDDGQSNGEIEIRGLIENLDATAKTFSLLGLQVDYSNAEIHGTVANGAFFKAEGRFDGTLIAREVELELDDHDDENIEARGIISDLDTQAQTFQLLGFEVDYRDAKRDFSLDNGMSVSLEGWLSALTIDATELSL